MQLQNNKERTKKASLRPADTRTHPHPPPATRSSPQLDKNHHTVLRSRWRTIRSERCDARVQDVYLHPRFGSLQILRRAEMERSMLIRCRCTQKKMMLLVLRGWHYRWDNTWNAIPEKIRWIAELSIEEFDSECWRQWVGELVQRSADASWLVPSFGNSGRLLPQKLSTRWFRFIPEMISEKKIQETISRIAALSQPRGVWPWMLATVGTAMVPCITRHTRTFPNYI